MATGSSSSVVKALTNLARRVKPTVGQVVHVPAQTYLVKQVRPASSLGTLVRMGCASTRMPKGSGSKSFENWNSTRNSSTGKPRTPSPSSTSTTLAIVGPSSIRFNEIASPQSTCVFFEPRSGLASACTLAYLSHFAGLGYTTDQRGPVWREPAHTLPREPQDIT